MDGIAVVASLEEGGPASVRKFFQICMFHHVLNAFLLLIKYFAGLSRGRGRDRLRVRGVRLSQRSGSCPDSATAEQRCTHSDEGGQGEDESFIVRADPYFC